MTWTIAKISEMIAGKVEESLTLDYKAAGALDRSKGGEIAKDVSAFANSAGGLLIYGVAEDPTNRHLPGKLDPVQGKTFSKEWLEAVILSNIQPKLTGFVIYPVRITDEECVYVIDIPQSDTAHQAKDGRYYKRHNFSSQYMEDYEIRDVMNRLKYPRIELEFSLILYTPQSTFPEFAAFDKTKKEDLVSLEVEATNTGSVTANHIVVKLGIPPQIAYVQMLLPYVKKSGGVDLPDFVPVTLNNQKQDTGPMGNRLSDPRYEPILPELSDDLGSCTLNDEAWITSNQDLEIQWSVHVDNAPSRSGTISLKEMRREDARK